MYLWQELKGKLPNKDIKNGRILYIKDDMEKLLNQKTLLGD